MVMASLERLAQMQRATCSGVYVLRRSYDGFKVKQGFRGGWKLD